MSRRRQQITTAVVAACATLALIPELACEATLGGPGPTPDGTGGAATGTTGTGTTTSAGGSGATTTTSSTGTTGGSSTTTTSSCAADCTSPGERSCSNDGSAVVECVDVGSATEPCLQWQVASSCGGQQTCVDGSCVAVCCTPLGNGCCTGDYSADCCEEADDCLMLAIRNGSEVCDDGRRSVDPAANRYFLVCLNDRGGIGYVAQNSGPACGNPSIPRCQCWEEQNEAPWDHLQYLTQITCDQAGQRVEVQFPSGGDYYIGVHPPPGGYPLAGYCPMGEGCMTCVGILEIPN